MWYRPSPVLTLGEVRGQNRVVEILQRAIDSDRMPHAYLFSGPRNAGTMETAFALSKAVNCLSAPGVGCSECDACYKIDASVHPDVQVLALTGKTGKISIETIRTQVIPAMAMAPHEAKARFFLVEEATDMLGPAANALLKALEEPPARTHFILCTHSASRLLPTIRSRCQRVGFQGLGSELRAQMQGDQELSEAIQALSQKICEAADSRGLNPILEAAQEAGDRHLLLGALERCAHIYHHLAREAACSDALATARAYSQRVGEILRSLVAIRDHNAHGQLALEHLLVALRNQPIPPALSRPSSTPQGVSR